MKKFDLNNFLNNYKPKGLVDLSPYLQLLPLNGYQWLQSKSEYKNLIPFDTYIKYIRIGYEFENDECLENHIEDGGLIVAGGSYINGQFVQTDDKKKWTYLKLDTNISKKTGKKGKHYNYIIKISNYNIFYQTIASDAFEVILSSFKSK